MPKGVRLGGRQKGTPNKSTQEAKDVIAFVAQGLGGAPGMLQWANDDEKNATIFWERIFPKLLPLTVSGDKDNPLKTVIELTFKSGV